MISVGRPIPPPVLPAAPPVTSTRFPVIDMPGCVRARIAVGNGVETFEKDPRGNVTLCTGAVPVFEAADYRPRDFTWVQPPQPAIKRPDVSSPAPSPQPTLPGADPDIPRLPKDPPCPPFGAQALGSFNKLGTKVLAGYELQDGKCVKLWDPVPLGRSSKTMSPQPGPR